MAHRPLSDRNAEIVRMYDEDCCSMGVIADRLSISRNTVAGVLGRAGAFLEPDERPLIRGKRRSRPVERAA